MAEKFPPNQETKERYKPSTPLQPLFLFRRRREKGENIIREKITRHRLHDEMLR